ncbi:hypothetical protein Hanom_Chr06g00547541 [Helianthus anomalus]
MKRMREAYKETVKAKRWDPDRECYLDPKGNICIDPKTIDFEALGKSIPTEEEPMRRDAKEKAKKERLEKAEKEKSFLRSWMKESVM